MEITNIQAKHLSGHSKPDQCLRGCSSACRLALPAANPSKLTDITNVVGNTHYDSGQPCLPEYSLVIIGRYKTKGGMHLLNRNFGDGLTVDICRVRFSAAVFFASTTTGQCASCHVARAAVTMPWRKEAAHAPSIPLRTALL